jgi:hypothetical protein
MVRHEAAEALGGIASEGDEGVEGELYENEEDKQKGVLGILREWSTLESAPPVVRESCQVALDMYEVSRHPPASLRSLIPGSDTDMESVAIVRKLEPVPIRRRTQDGRLGTCGTDARPAIDRDGQGCRFDLDHGLKS